MLETSEAYYPGYEPPSFIPQCRFGEVDEQIGTLRELLVSSRDRNRNRHGGCS